MPSHTAFGFPPKARGRPARARARREGRGRRRRQGREACDASFGDGAERRPSFYQPLVASEARRATVASISRRDMEMEGGSAGTSFHANHRASAISVASGRISPPAYSAVYAIMSEGGNAHAWLLRRGCGPPAPA